MIEENIRDKPPALWDVDIIVRECEDLPRMDLIGHADPYITLQITSPDRTQSFNYKTSVIYNTLNPIWNEEIFLQNVPIGSICSFQIHDKDHLSMDDHIGSVKLPLDSACVTAAVARSVGAAEGATVPHVASSSSCEQPDIDGCRCRLRLPIQAAPGVPAAAGHLLLELRCRAACCESSPSSSSSSSSSSSPRVMLHRGPVRYRISMSALAGALTGHNQDDGLLAFAAYKVNLAGLSLFFQTGASVHWNTNYDKARLLFNSVAAVQTVRMQHSLLYKDDGQQGSRGVLRGGGDLVVLLRGGVRAQQRRYYTYVLMDDGSWRFSETGAAFFSDIMSKHAMHAGCAEKVVYAGEFCLLPGDLDASWSVYQGASLAALVTEADAAASTSALAGVGGAEAGNWTLVADNNSGTYAPPAALLPALAALLRHNFPGLRVEVLERNDARLVALRSRVPSRGAG